MSAAALPRTAGDGDRALALPVARGVAFAGLAGFGALHWMALLEPAAAGRAGYGVLAAIVVMALLLVAGRLRRPARTVLAGVAVLAGAVMALPAGGVADELLRPDRWGELVAGIGRGIASLPGARVPYRGVDEWTRTVLGVGGTALTVLAALAAFWPRPGGLGLRNVSLILLVTLYAVPAVALDFGGEFLRGALLVVLVLAYLRLETLPVSDAGAAGALAVAVAVGGLVAAPALDKDQPWWDYERWALSTAAAKTAEFRWEHNYGPLHWPRDGRELLRVKAKDAAYWKATNLDDFDGKVWRDSLSAGTSEGCDIANSYIDPENAVRWQQEIRVSVRNLRTPLFITAGIACRLESNRVRNLPLGDGTYGTQMRSLRRGDAYEALVYTPSPTQRERGLAGDDYPGFLSRYTSIELPSPGFAPSGEERAHQVVQFPLWGDRLSSPTAYPSNLPPDEADALKVRAGPVLEASAFSRTWALARELRRGARTADDFVLAVQRHLGDDYAYSESPPTSAATLDGFLFDAKIGYCQQFSGAMALLLRMGGVPARVATGFTSGSYDRKAGEYVVRDLDAHSWVEVWYPGIGWATFDPTPATAPPRSQPDEGATTAGGRAAAPDLGGDIRSDPSRQVEVVQAGASPFAIAALAAAGLGLLALVVLGVRRRLRRGPADHGPLAELERALRRMRRAPGPGTTLSGLESRFARSPAAAAYVRAVREQRYGGRAATPTGEQRRALRNELARGAGMRGRVRAWWAIPPHLRRPGLH